jgi:hypothetical protein
VTALDTILPKEKLPYKFSLLVLLQVKASYNWRSPHLGEGMP